MGAAARGVARPVLSRPPSVIPATERAPTAAGPTPGLDTSGRLRRSLPATRECPRRHAHTHQPGSRQGNPREGHRISYLLLPDMQRLKITTADTSPLVTRSRAVGSGEVASGPTREAPEALACSSAGCRPAWALDGGLSPWLAASRRPPSVPCHVGPSERFSLGGWLHGREHAKREDGR